MQSPLVYKTLANRMSILVNRMSIFSIVTWCYWAQNLPDKPSNRCTTFTFVNNTGSGLGAVWRGLQSKCGISSELALQVSTNGYYRGHLTCIVYICVQMYVKKLAWLTEQIRNIIPQFALQVTTNSYYIGHLTCIIYICVQTLLC